MIKRRALQTVLKLLDMFPAVGILGPRQVGKTTLAKKIASARESVYLDLEVSSDREKLYDPALYLSAHEDNLVVLDEIQSILELFRELRSVIDLRRESGRRAGCFLIVGSASVELLKQSSETLAGRIAYVKLDPFNVLEVEPAPRDDLWLRGGFPTVFWREATRTAIAGGQALSGLTWRGTSRRSARGFRPRLCGVSGPCSPTRRANS